jgi:cathepsin C
MIYDEGFEFSYENVKYFAFSKYAISGSESQSYCDETLIGWYNNINTGERGCYRARKSERLAPQVIQIDFIVTLFKNNN